MSWDEQAQGTEGQRVAALEAAVAELTRRVEALEGRGASAPAPVVDAVDPWSVPPWPEVVALLQRGKKIAAIKVYREHTGVGLQEAKNTVEEVERRLG